MIIEGREVGRDHLAHRREIGRRGGDRDEDVTAGALGVGRLQTVLGGVEIRLVHGAGADEPAVRIVAPLVVRTDEALRRSVCRVADLEAAMAAGVVVRVDAPVGGAGHDQRVLADLQGEIIARLRDFAIVPGEYPFAMEEMIEIELVERLFPVEIAGKGVALFAVGQLVEHQVG
jgi:hypothetical protein